jgi:hypothetical protein
MQKLYRFSYQKGQIRIWYNCFRSGSDLAKQFQIRPNSDLQNCRKGLYISRIRTVCSVQVHPASKLIRRPSLQIGSATKCRYVVLDTCRPYMSSLYICTKPNTIINNYFSGSYVSHLTYIFLLLRIVKFYLNTYTGDPLRSTRSLHAVHTCQKSHPHAKSTRVVSVVC